MIMKRYKLLFLSTIFSLFGGIFILPAAHAALTYSMHMDGVNSSIATQLSNSMAEAVNIYNANGTFDKHLNVYYNAGVPTAQANYDGVITFGGSRNTRVAIHEISHTLGIGTHSAYWSLITGGTWNGPVANAVLSEFDGQGSAMNGDSQHMWPYGLNYDSEDSNTNRLRHVAIVQAMRCDMSVGPCTNNANSLEGTNRTIINRASGKVLDAVSNSNGGNLIIYSDYGTTNQRWNISHLGNGEYSIRNMQNSNRSMDTWNWGTSDGTNMALFDYWGGDAQRFYFEEIEAGWYRITPVIAGDQCIDAFGTASGVNVGTWSYWGGHNQQWKIQ